MVSPGPVTNRKAEHLGTTDRGVVLFRRMLANAIAAIRDGNTPALPRLYAADTPVRTYAHETVLRLPTPDALPDRQSLAAFGRRAASVIIEMNDVPVERRDEVAAARIASVLEKTCAEEREVAARV
jgi:hypothetical protein